MIGTKHGMHLYSNKNKFVKISGFLYRLLKNVGSLECCKE